MGIMSEFVQDLSYLWKTAEVHNKILLHVYAVTAFFLSGSRHNNGLASLSSWDLTKDANENLTSLAFLSGEDL